MAHTETIIERPQVEAREHRRSGRANILILGLFAVLAALMIGSLTLGRYPVPVGQIIHILLTTSPLHATRSYADQPWVVVEIIRLPSILVVTLAGMGLALSGAAMQGVFRNPLVGPEVAGVSSGAACGGVLAIMLSLPMLGVVALAFGFGLLALTAALGLAKLSGTGSMLALVLSGVIVGSLFSAAVGLMETLADPSSKLPTILFWLLGSFAGATYEKVAIISGVTLVAGTLLFLEDTGQGVEA